VRRSARGSPGSSKTTAVARLIELLRREGLTVAGFLTASSASEVNASVSRLRHSTAGAACRHTSASAVDSACDATASPHDDLERLAIPALSAHADVVVVDELGKMELTSAAFRVP
jgi:nucleoside-triphosphatase THEP1